MRTASLSRRIAIWSAITLCALAFVIWTLTMLGLRVAYWRPVEPPIANQNWEGGRGRYFYIGSGTFQSGLCAMAKPEYASSVEWQRPRAPYGFPSFSSIGWFPNGTYFLPLWPIGLASALILLAAWRVRAAHRRTAGWTALFCPNCNYNMTCNVSGKCPECGTPSVKNPLPLKSTPPTIEQTRTTSAPPRLDHSDQNG